MNIISEYAKQAKALRNHPFVLAWIRDYQGDAPRRHHQDCPSCTYPHAKGLLCGSGATFGQLQVGRDIYYVDWSNVCSFVEFRSEQRAGFHWRDDTYFERLGDGSVKVTYFTQYNNCPQEQSWIIPAAEWASIICAVSLLGETGERWEYALDFHGRITEAT